MPEFAVRSPNAKVGEIVYFGRMIDKIRVHAKGNLPPEYRRIWGKVSTVTVSTFSESNTHRWLNA